MSENHPGSAAPPPVTPPPAAPAPPPERSRPDHRDLSRVVLYYALALAALLLGIGALLIGIAWSDMADVADNGRSFW
ncbi:hypothetical protein ACIQNG_08965 [Streptomyces sp. NPDC091377]|uniref:hypothetical protein n=1 Tax=unclassified Streptomyces TaxID=2593676 RepID=UPI00381BD2DD